MAKNRIFRWWIVLPVLIFIILAAFFTYTRMTSKPPAVDAANLAKVEKGDIALSVVATGVIEPISNRIEIRSKASGIVKQVNVDAGDRVAPDQVLVELDRDQLLAQLREAEANLLAARADAMAARAELKRSRILAEEYDVQLARANHQRSTELFEDKLLSKSDYDVTKGKLEEALNRQRAASAGIGVTEASIAQKEAQVAQVQAMVDRIQEELKYTSVRSPIHGIVLSRAVEIGSAVSSILSMGAGATTILVLGDMTSVYVRGQVNENDIGRVRLNLPVRITVETYKGKVFRGSVHKIAPLGQQMNNATSFEARISVENPEGLLLANMSANAEIILDEHKGVLVIPEGALVLNSDKSASVEVPDSMAKTGRRRVAVKTGISTGTKVEVLSGLNEGAQVILQ